MKFYSFFIYLMLIIQVFRNEVSVKNVYYDIIKLVDPNTLELNVTKRVTKWPSLA